VNRLMGWLAGGHLILTSRLDSFARQVEPLEIDMLSWEAAAAFLVRRPIRGGARRWMTMRRQVN
jgi:hypothetical protein